MYVKLKKYLDGSRRESTRINHFLILCHSGWRPHLTPRTRGLHSLLGVKQQREDPMGSPTENPPGEAKPKPKVEAKVGSQCWKLQREGKSGKPKHEANV